MSTLLIDFIIVEPIYTFLNVDRKHVAILLFESKKTCSHLIV